MLQAAGWQDGHGRTQAATLQTTDADLLWLQAVLVHQLSRGLTQTPFRKNKGRVVDVAFHPTKPFFFVASQHQVRSAASLISGAYLVPIWCLCCCDMVKQH